MKTGLSGKAMPHHEIDEVENGHEWCRSQSAIAPGDYCRLCMCMRPKGAIGPCTGSAEIALRNFAAAEDNQPLSVGGLMTKLAAMNDGERNPMNDERVVSANVATEVLEKAVRDTMEADRAQLQAALRLVGRASWGECIEAVERLARGTQETT